jgi:hypothetical protein
MSQIYTRTMFGLDVATGKEKYEAKGDCLYKTTGPLTVRDVDEVLPPIPEILCYIFNAEGSCTPNQMYALGNETAIIKDYYVVDPMPEM